MGNYRSRSGCLTCRARRVKCDETRPACKACSKKNRPCQWDAPQNKFKSYEPGATSSKSGANDADAGSEAMEVDEEGEGSMANYPKAHGGAFSRKDSRADSRSEAPSSNTSTSTSTSQQSPEGAYQVQQDEGTRSMGGQNHSESNPAQGDVVPGTRAYSRTPIPLTHDEAVLVHHYTEYLGRWLDCTDATRQFTFGVPGKVKLCPVLCHAVLSFAARHRKDAVTAEAAYHRCIALLIDRLNEDAASHDETLLCAIVILRFYEQLSVSATTGSDDENHLSGTSAILRASQGHHFVDPSAPTLREAAFWVYVRQCLYNATINQQPPNIDFSLQLHPTPESMQDAHPLARLRLETAWSNQMTWNLALVVNYCFDGSEAQGERIQRDRRWQELWDQVEQWSEKRPEAFDPIWQGEAGENGPFPEVWFTSDWHVVSFGFYHFACILLLTYKPGFKFAIRNPAVLTDTGRRILEHSRIICGAGKSSPETVPISITICHTIFIWGPLVSDPLEREEIVDLLVNFEKNHFWPTTWIINALKKVWGLL